MWAFLTGGFAVVECEQAARGSAEILKDAESGVPVADLLRKHGVSKATLFKWRSE